MTVRKAERNRRRRSMWMTLFTRMRHHGYTFFSYINIYIVCVYLNKNTRKPERERKKTPHISIQLFLFSTIFALSTLFIRLSIFFSLHTEPTAHLSGWLKCMNIQTHTHTRHTHTIYISFWNFIFIFTHTQQASTQDHIIIVCDSSSFPKLKDIEPEWSK